jgi:undecaprenyl-diphosphatase
MYLPSWAKNILFLLVFMISGLVLVLVIEGLVSGNELLPFNTAIEEAMVEIRTPLLTTFLVFVTRLGSPFLFSAVAVFLAVYLFSRRDYYNALLFLSAMAIAVVSFAVLKNVFQITRPGSDLVDASGWSFPSGHATMATTFFFLLAHAFFRRMRTGFSAFNLVVGSVLGAALVSLSRLYLGAHWALDILAGIALGLLSVSFTVLLFNIFPEKWRLSQVE